MLPWKLTSSCRVSEMDVSYVHTGTDLTAAKVMVNILCEGNLKPLA